MSIVLEKLEKIPAKIRFGLFEAEPSTGELRKSGTRIRIQAQPFRILQYLLERPNRMVTREELQAAFWKGDTTVDLDRSLAAAIHKIRNCLGDSVVNPRYIETVARSGYRFICPVTVIESPTAIASHPPERAAMPEIDFPAHGAPSADQPAIRSRALLAPYAFVALAAGLIGAALTWRVTRHQTFTAHMIPLTSSGRVAASDPMFDGSPELVTDGSRIYFPQLEQGRAMLAEVLVNGGASTLVALPEEIGSPHVDDISPDGFRLLLRNHLSTAAEQPVWVASTEGHAARQVPGALAHASAWMPDGQSILYANGTSLYIVRDNGTENRRLTSLPGRASGMHWSPDGTHLRLTVSNDQTLTGALWELDADGSHPRQLLSGWSGPSDVCCGNWTKDGSHYVFQANTPGSSSIWDIPESSGLFGGAGKPILIADGPFNLQSPLTARDGHQVIVIGTSIRSQLMQLDPRSATFVPAAENLRDASSVDFSRDHRWVSWVNGRDGTLWRSREDGSERFPLVGKPYASFRSRWSPDGTQIALMARKQGESWRIYLADARNGHIEPLFAEDHGQADPEWSPDGKSILFGRPAGHMGEPSLPRALYLIDLATRQIIKLPGSDGLFSPRWSANGRYIAALSQDQTRLMLYNTQTKSWSQVAQFNIDNPLWFSDDSAIFFRDFVQPGQPIYRLTLATGRLERVAGLANLLSANAADFTLAGLLPNDLPLVAARTSVADLYTSPLPE